MAFVRRAIEGGARSVIDFGGGASRLVDRLLDEQLERVAVLDVSSRALAAASERLGARAGAVHWILGDATELEDVGSFEVWHDRAVFHFLVAEDDRGRYLKLMERTVPTGGFVIVATFGLDGPERCSGLDVRRYDPTLLSGELGGAFEILEDLARTHLTPRGIEQRFTYAMFRRV